VVKITALKNAVTSAQPLPFQNSSEFIILAQSDGFIELPPEPNHFKAGDCFPFYPW
jgi:molybdopterin molybdotransferase